MDLTFTVNKQYIRRIDTSRIVADSKNYLTAIFVFSDDDWNNVNKTAIFKHGENTYYKILKDNQCVIPSEVIKPDEFTVAVIGGTLLTTNDCYINVTPSGLPCGSTPETTPDVYAQILDIAINADNTAKEALDLVESMTPEGILEIKEMVEQAKIDSEDAKNIATESKTLATDASNTANEAYDLASGISSIATDAKSIAMQANTSAKEAKQQSQEVRDYVDSLASSLTGFTVSILPQLPETGENGVIYLVPKTGRSADTGDIYDEYIWLGSKYELMGTTGTDLEDYYTKVQVDTYLANKADKSQIKPIQDSADQANLTATEAKNSVDSLQIDINNLKNTKADRTEIENVVKYKEFTHDAEQRKTIELANFDNISGLDTDGVGHNLLMVSKWNKVDVGSPGTTMNLNTKDIVTINDTKTVATTGDVQAVKEQVDSLETDINTNIQQINTTLDTKQNKLVAGTNVEITADNVINVTASSGGTNDYNDLINKPTIPTKTSELINDSNFVTSALLDLKQNKLVAGDNITIDGNTISATVTTTGGATKLSELENDVGFVTQTYVNEKIAEIPQMSVKVVGQLPEIGDNKVIYLISKPGSTGDVYNEYLWVSATNKYELIGSTDIDLSGYATTQQLQIIADSLKTVATTGDYNDLTNKPIIPTKVGDLDNDSNFITTDYLTMYATKADVTTMLGNYNELYPATLLQEVKNNVGGFKVGDSLTGLTLAKIIETILCMEPGKVDKTKLNEAITAAASYTDSTLYTPTTWSVFNDALTTATTIRDDANATQEQVDAATTALNEAITGLVLLKEIPVPVIQNTQNESSVNLNTKVFEFPVQESSILVGNYSIDDSKVTITGATGTVTHTNNIITITLTSAITAEQQVTFTFAEGVVTNNGDGIEYKLGSKVSVAATKVITYANTADPWGSYVWVTDPLMATGNVTEIRDAVFLEKIIADYNADSDPDKNNFWSVFDSGAYELHVIGTVGEDPSTYVYDRIIKCAGTNQVTNLDTNANMLQGRTLTDWAFNETYINWKGGNIAEAIFVLLRRN